MLGTPTPASERAHLSDIAYGFMASQAMFIALEEGVFNALAQGPLTCAELSAITGTAGNRLKTMLHALTALGLTVVDGDRYTNAPAAQRWLVNGERDNIGEYYRLQVGRQIYPALFKLHAGMAGTGAAFDTLRGLLSDPAEARTFIAAQHVGSLEAARVLAGRMPVRGARRLLDVGAGSGAFRSPSASAIPGSGRPCWIYGKSSPWRGTTAARRASARESSSWPATP
jgi:hypothetical protein